jgi:hypothetical protein
MMGVPGILKQELWRFWIEEQCLAGSVFGFVVAAISAKRRDQMRFALIPRRRLLCSVTIRNKLIRSSACTS